MNENKNDIIEKLLEAPCRVIDILPKQVPAEGGKRYFQFEKYMEKPPFINEIYSKFSAVLMKLNCYYDMLMANDPEKDWSLNPSPEKTILVGYYIGCQDMNKIAKDIGYELKYCYKLRKKGREML